jgi:hypothetical protein
MHKRVVAGNRQKCRNARRGGSGLIRHCFFAGSRIYRTALCVNGKTGHKIWGALPILYEGCIKSTVLLINRLTFFLIDPSRRTL